MKQTNNAADLALAYIRHNTAAPIQRFLDSVIVARLEGGSSSYAMAKGNRLESGSYVTSAE
jgi:hypothetical protein